MLHWLQWSQILHCNRGRVLQSYCTFISKKFCNYPVQWTGTILLLQTLKTNWYHTITPAFIFLKLFYFDEGFSLKLGMHAYKQRNKWLFATLNTVFPVFSFPPNQIWSPSCHDNSLVWTWFSIVCLMWMNCGKVKLIPRLNTAKWAQCVPQKEIKNTFPAQFVYSRQDE